MKRVLFAIIVVFGYLYFTDAPVLKKLFADEPSSSDMEKAIRLKTESILSSYELSTGKKGVSVSSIDIEKDSCAVYMGVDYLCGFKYRINFEGGRTRAGHETMKFKKTDEGWMDSEGLKLKSTMRDEKAFLQLCKKQEAGIAMELGGLSEDEATNRADEACKSALNDIKNCMTSSNWSFDKCKEKLESETEED